MPEDHDCFMDGGLREAFAYEPPDRSVLDRIERLAGRKSRILLHDLSDDDSPLLRTHPLSADRMTTPGTGSWARSRAFWNDVVALLERARE